MCKKHSHVFFARKIANYKQTTYQRKIIDIPWEILGDDGKVGWASHSPHKKNNIWMA